MDRVNKEYLRQSTFDAHVLTGVHLNHARKVMSLILAVSDLFSFILVGLISIQLRAWLIDPGGSDLYTQVLVLAGLGLLIYAGRGLYPAIGMGGIEEFRSLTISTSLLYVIYAALTYVLKPSLPFSRLVFGEMWLLSLVLVPANRSLLRHLMARMGAWGEPVALIGSKEQVTKLADYFIQDPISGLRPTVLLIPVGGNLIDLKTRAIYPVLELYAHPALRKVHTALVLYHELDELHGIRETYQDTFERLILVGDTRYEKDLSSTSVHSYGKVTGLKIRYTLLDRSAQILKRGIDLALSALGLIGLAPILGMLTVLVKAGSPGPIFYRQKRIGWQGKEFVMLKFRTMYQDADQVLDLHLAQNPEMKAEWDTYQKINRDPRVTRIGAFLRRFSLDELPQLWNVLIGEMSLVGPRPIMLTQRGIYGENFKHYMRVLPGITGLWQISGRNHASYSERIEFDVQYVNNWSVWLDIYILIRTIWVVARASGAS